MSTSVIIPSRNEAHLNRTLDSIYAKFVGDFEVIVYLDGESEFPVNCTHPNMSVIESTNPVGVRKAINDAVAFSQGDYILKLDAHCGVGENFDQILHDSCEDNWVMVARRYTLDTNTWKKYSRNVDYYYLSCPWTNRRAFMMQSCPWIGKTGERSNIPIDDLMAFQGSMWFMSRNHWDWLGGLELGNEDYAEHHEISMKTWLGGGRVVINKRAWYAHPRTNSRGYHMSINQVYRDHELSARKWTGNQWGGRIHDFDWLIDKFWPLPMENTRHRIERYYWPEDWKKYYGKA